MTASPVTETTLAEFQATYRYVYVDAGARWGARADILKIFPKGVWVGFEPDAEEAERVRAAARPNEICLEYALGSSSGKGRLQVTASPDWSSLYKPDPDVYLRFHGLETRLPVESTIEVDLKSLDEVVEENPELLDKPDYLKLDVQGAEADILRGSSASLESVKAIEVEAEFDSVYIDQPLFGDVHKLLLDSSFRLFAMTRNRCFRRVFPWDMDTRGQLLWTDVIYLRDHVPLVEASDQESLTVLALTALNLGFEDYAWEIVNDMVSAGLADERRRGEFAENISRRRSSQRRNNRFVNAIAAMPAGRRTLRWFRNWIDRNYDRIVSLGNPEPDYYFRRD